MQNRAIYRISALRNDFPCLHLLVCGDGNFRQLSVDRAVSSAVGEDDDVPQSRNEGDNGNVSIGDSLNIRSRFHSNVNTCIFSDGFQDRVHLVSEPRRDGAG